MTGLPMASEDSSRGAGGRPDPTGTVKEDSGRLPEK